MAVRLEHGFEDGVAVGVSEQDITVADFGDRVGDESPDREDHLLLDVRLDGLRDGGLGVHLRGHRVELAEHELQVLDGVTHGDGEGAAFREKLNLLVQPRR